MSIVLKKKLLDWIIKVRKELPHFLSLMEANKVPGGFKYAYNADLLSVFKSRYGLANTVFAVKIMQMVGLNEYFESRKTDLSSFIRSFLNKETGEITDPAVRMLSLPKRLISGFTSSRLIYSDIKRAETRQAYAALSILGNIPANSYMIDRFNKKAVKDFFYSLDWGNPWEAGSHVSHLTFFMNLHHKLGSLNDDKFEELSSLIVGLLDQIQNADGSWGINIESLDINKKVNGIMKVLLALDPLHLQEISRIENIIDLVKKSLSSSRGACDNTDIIFVLNRSAHYTDLASMKSEIERICFLQLATIKEHYYKDLGGFSFYRGKCNVSYYGALVAFPKNTPDMHGTVLYLWGIILILELLGLKDKYGFSELIT